ncbi:MAG: glycosyltransferase [Actinomycetota bacterium]
MGSDGVGDERMRIVRYHPRAAVGDGGMTGAIRRWSESVASLGADVSVAFEKGSEPPEGNGVRWIPVRHGGSGRTRMPLRLEDALRGADLLVLHSAWSLHNVRAAAVARKLKVPYLLEPRGAYDPHIVARKRRVKQAWWLAAERKLVDGARAIHVFFEPERSHLKAIGYRGPVVVAPNGPPLPGRSWDGGTGGYILWLGRFDPQHKGLDLLVRGLDELPPDQRPHLRIQGPDWRGRKQQVVSMVEDLGLGEWVTIGDPVYGEGKTNLLAMSTGFVYPSRWDACPNALLEAAAMGIPTVATPYPLGVYLASRGGAFLADATVDGVAGALQKLGSDRADEVGRIGAKVVGDELPWEAVARSWLQQVEAVL